MLALKRNKILKCSFCGKTASQVARMIGGPSVHICDECVGVSNKILEAITADFASWDAMADERSLGALKSAEATVEATRSVLQAQIHELRKRAVSWETIGAALGISRQAAGNGFPNKDGHKFRIPYRAAPVASPAAVAVCAISHRSGPSPPSFAAGPSGRARLCTPVQK